MLSAKYFGAFLLVGASLAHATAPTPGYAISSTSIGINQAIYVNGNNGYQTAGGGGEFAGTLSGTSAAFWCVDDQEAFGFGQTGLANVTLLSNTAVINSASTHYGTVTNTSSPSSPGQWLNTGTGASSSTPGLADAMTAQNRYTLAAYLVAQYQGFDTSILGGAAQAEDDAIQQAIWAITNTTLPQGALNGGIYENNNRSVNATTGAGNVDSSAYWINQAITHYGDVVQSGWAVVSWGAAADGTLYQGPYYASQSTNQTFLVELGSGPQITTGGSGLAPEPGFYAALAVGLSGLFFAVRRRRKA